MKTQTTDFHFTGTEGFGDFVVMQTPMPMPAGMNIWMETGEEAWNVKGGEKCQWTGD